MTLNDLLQRRQIDPMKVLVFRHRPHEPELRKVLPWLAAERPAVFNAYQQTQGPKLERALESLVGRGFVASFIGHGPGKAVFVGLYAIDASRPLTYKQYWNVQAYVEMKAFGLKGWSSRRQVRAHKLRFDLTRTEFYADWEGRLIVTWPPPERSWWRRAHRNEIRVSAILEQSALGAVMPEWSDITLSWV